MSSRRPRSPVISGFVLFLACNRGAPPQPPSDVAAPAPDVAGRTAAPAVVSDGPPRLFRNARIMTAAGDIFERADLLVVGGRISAVGPDLKAPDGAVVVDATGKTITPGVIDTHSHLGVYAAPGLNGHSDGNEASAPNTAHVRAEDGYWPQDPQIDRARAGGVTTAQILPGSANLIGGRSVTVRFLPDARSVDDVKFPGAPYGLKMACGENPKRVYGDKAGPKTRMGNIAGFRDAFQKAKEYERTVSKYHKDHADWEKNKDKPQPAGKDGQPGKPPDEPQPPTRDFGLETLGLVLKGEILVHNHCYRADEMSQMLDLAATYGFKIRSFHHAVEAYKIADRLAAADTAASIWADWWGFKAEAFDGILENAALLHAAGGRSIIHSDSPTGIQRLNQEAAKAMHAGRRAGIDISENDALRWFTANAAWALGIDHEVGTLTPGKRADVVVWSGSPFSVYTRAEQVYIDGEPVYVRGQLEPGTDFELGYNPGAAPPAPVAPVPSNMSAAH
ncbi:amidohydrolase family protein [Nannocystis sp. ILAH1]|uniref:amidohydrolase n=1 Tax=unclassified Nannocystis TaxID=2627009 RepID=UPI0022710629|nr:amidohydrolase family protein [Nannocystis sp. ILAH1]MCY1067903.1 amidohydrolase family protein [Nannocystis sp. RBIL2]